VDPVTIVVPARNEAQRLASLLDALTVALPPSAQIVVVDDHSTDGTGDIARRYPVVRVLAAPHLPPGWTGKAWACHTRAQAATAGDLVFLDADVVVRPEALLRALAFRREHGGLLSIWPYHRVERAYEHLSALFNVTTLMSLGAGSLLPSRNLREALGPVIVTTTADYGRVGGHEAVRSDVVEDLRLGRRYADAGLPVTVLGGGGDVWFRMYGEGPGALVRGWTRSFGCGTFAVSPLRVVGIAFWITCAYGAFLWMGGLRSWPAYALTALFAVQMGVMFRRVGNFGWVDALLYPLHLVFLTLVFAAGIFLAKIRHRVHWRGREVEVAGEPGPGG
jgi:4,4'-diaponeurosporenoate glycosyltransferase